MKILWLGTSNDVDGYLPKEQRLPQLAKLRLAEVLKTEIEVEAYDAWPSARLPSMVEKWMDKHEPDLVFFKANTFAFSFESVPLKLERSLGSVGKYIANAGRKSTELGWFSASPPYHAGKRLAPRLSAALRLVSGSEGVSHPHGFAS